MHGLPFVVMIQMFCFALMVKTNKQTNKPYLELVTEFRWSQSCWQCLHPENRKPVNIHRLSQSRLSRVLALAHQCHRFFTASLPWYLLALTSTVNTGCCALHCLHGWLSTGSGELDGGTVLKLVSPDKLFSRTLGKPSFTACFLDLESLALALGWAG